MAAEVEKVPGGWPFGLRSLTFRLWTMNLQAAATPPNSRHIHSDSFPSCSSSDLDTESTRSFFQERSRTLGSLIGMTTVNGNLCVARSLLSEEMECTAMMGLLHDPAERDERMFSTCCICVPLMESVLPVRTGTSRQ